MSEVCRKLHRISNSMRRFTFPFECNEMPRNGIYVLFESGEKAHGGDRIVRIGTHTGDNQLRSRLRQHFIKENKDRSIFRKNIGRALLSRDGDEFLAQWNRDMTSLENRRKFWSETDSFKKAKIEGRVSEYIRSNFSFGVFAVTGRDERLRLESRMVSTVSICEECRPSGTWLGFDSPIPKIRESGLWQVNELYKTGLSMDELDALAEMIHRQ